MSREEKIERIEQILKGEFQTEYIDEAKDIRIEKDGEIIGFLGVIMLEFDNILSGFFYTRKTRRLINILNKAGFLVTTNYDLARGE